MTSGQRSWMTVLFFAASNKRSKLQKPGSEDAELLIGVTLIENHITPQCILHAILPICSMVGIGKILFNQIQELRISTNLAG